MQLESIEFSFLSIFTLLTFFIFLTISKYSYKIKNGALLDKDFSKPQAFHRNAVSRSGGVAGIISLNIFFLIYFLLYSNILNEYNIKLNIYKYENIVILLTQWLLSAKIHLHKMNCFKNISTNFHFH